MQATEQRPSLSQRERELAAILKAYSEVTDHLKTAHEQLNHEVAGLREELKQKNVELRRKDRLAALGEMAAGLAHEVRNPLGGIALYASMLERQLEGQPKPQNAAVKISQGVRTLDRLVSEILDFAQEDHLQRQTCKLGVILGEVRQAVSPWADDAKAAVTIDPAATDIIVDCDPPRLRQALLNLLINAAQAAGENGHATLNASRDDAGAVRIEVADNGPGIPRDKLDRIFNPFFTTKASGTGLGLAIVHRIAEAHGGSVRASNKTEGGARFVLSLPPQT